MFTKLLQFKTFCNSPVELMNFSIFSSFPPREGYSQPFQLKPKYSYILNIFPSFYKIYILPKYGTKNLFNFMPEGNLSGSQNKQNSKPESVRMSFSKWATRFQKIISSCEDTDTDKNATTAFRKGQTLKIQQVCFKTLILV